MLFSIFIESMNMLYRRRAGPLHPSGYLPRRPPPENGNDENRQDGDRQN
jgi:hypothetical protein